MQAAALAHAIEELNRQLEARSEERRQAERDTANQGAALKQMEAEVQRIDRRLQEWTAPGRAQQGRRAKPSASSSSRSAKKPSGLRPSTQTAEAALESQQAALAELRQKRESLQQEAAQLTAELAGLEERRRGAEAAFQRIDRLHADLERRVLAIEQQRAAAEAEREQRIRESATLAERQQELTAPARRGARASAEPRRGSAGLAPATGSA